MKGKVISIVMAASLLMSAGIVLAQAVPSVSLFANVPFVFQAGEQTLPAGEYRLSVFSNGMMVLRGEKSNEAFNLASSSGVQRSDNQPRFVFHRYDDQYFLSEVFSGSDSGGRKLSVTRQEKEHLHAEMRPAAGSSRASDVVILASHQQTLLK